MKKQKLVATSAILILTALLCSAKPASALPGWKNIPLGQTYIKENESYARAHRKQPLPTPPWDRNDLCKWNYGRSDAYGSAAGWWGRENWKTNCYYKSWRW